MIVHKADYSDKMKNLLNGTGKFEKINRKIDGISNFAVNQEKPVNNILKILVVSNSISEETRISFKLVATKPGKMYGLGEVHKIIINDCPPFRHIL